MKIFNARLHLISCSFSLDSNICFEDNQNEYHNHKSFNSISVSIESYFERIKMKLCQEKFRRRDIPKCFLSKRTRALWCRLPAPIHWPVAANTMVHFQISNGGLRRLADEPRNQAIVNVAAERLGSGLDRPKPIVNRIFSANTRTVDQYTEALVAEVSSN